MGPTPKPPYYMQLNIMEVHGGSAPVRPEYIGAFDGKVRQGHAEYVAALRQVSVDIKEFVDELTAMPGMDDTLFIITSDHGQGLTDHPAVFAGQHGFVLYESNVIVPLIFYHHLQGIGGREVNEKVQLLDLAATNKLAEHSAEAATMEAYLRSWETAHPKAKRLRREELSKETIEHLKALGYVE